MGTDKQLLAKGIKSFGYTAILMFLSPAILSQAFKNEENPLYIPVLILGSILGLLAIYMGFKSVNIVMDALFGKKNKD
ncbi:DUF6095 family protein [uncultured Allomuricauda sp.]|uniref:DUF6095 family protein n=1 Tax=Flagellimonas sp. W118 TaxID=3410791 RepID=UPI00260C3140|nr:DUF6095 family protein [uncultured Allomuricauda sp.]